MKHTALFSLNDISDAEHFAEQLIQLGWDIIASSETGVSAREVQRLLQALNQKPTY